MPRTSADAARFRDLAEQAMRQHHQLDEVHAYARRRAFRQEQSLSG